MGNAGGETELGLCYLSGRGTDRDINNSVYWLKRGADAGNAVVLNAMGLLFSQGNGVPQNDAQAIAMFHRAANGGLADAYYNLGWMAQNGALSGRITPGRRISFTKGADLQSWKCAISLGDMYRDGLGVAPDANKARQFYQQAEAMGSA